LHHVWIAQRSQRYFQNLHEAEQNQIIAMLASVNGAGLLSAPVRWVIERRANRLTIG
jgi:hypothetical protein